MSITVRTIKYQLSYQPQRVRVLEVTGRRSLHSQVWCLRLQVPTPEGLTAYDLDNIRLAAQFVARNGRAFLAGLAAKEAGNPAFNFLKPTHSLFGFFSALCDAYQKVLMPKKGTMEKLRRNCSDRCAAASCPGTADCYRWNYSGTGGIRPLTRCHSLRLSASQSTFSRVIHWVFICSW